MNNWKRFGLSVVAEDLSGSLQCGGDSALHARRINGVFYIVPRQVEACDLPFWTRAVRPGPDGVDEQRHIRVWIHFPAFDIGRCNWEVFSYGASLGRKDIAWRA